MSLMAMEAARSRRAHVQRVVRSLASAARTPMLIARFTDGDGIATLASPASGAHHERASTLAAAVLFPDVLIVGDRGHIARPRVVGAQDMTRIVAHDTREWCARAAAQQCTERMRTMDIAICCAAVSCSSVI